MVWKVSVDVDICIGDVICVSFCLDVFEMGDDGKVYLVVEIIDFDCVQEVVEVCLVGVIIFEEV